MDLTINLTGIQENSKYVLEFSLSRDGKLVVNNTQETPQSDGKPSLDNIENENKPTLDDAPTMEVPTMDTPKKSYKDFKVTSNLNEKKIK
jgi:hypothetical protein